jgi:hypothetical protein
MSERDELAALPACWKCGLGIRFAEGRVWDFVAGNGERLPRHEDPEDCVIALQNVRGCTDHARLLLGLLAVMHRDGGQHTESVGVVQSVADAKDRWHERGEAADIGDQWLADSSLAKWFPLTAVDLKNTYRDLADARAMLESLDARLVERQRERDEARSEVARLRARVRVESEDVERAGVTLSKVRAWLLDHDLLAEPNTMWGDRWAGYGYLHHSDRSKDIANAIGNLVRGVRRPGLDILDEMAAMEVTP